jgi:hypothetical protein
MRFDISTVRNTGRTHFKKGEPSAHLGRKHSEEAKAKMSDDRKGFCNNTGRTHFPKGYVPWNKGKKGVYSGERLRQISEESKARMAINHPMKGKKHTPETIEKIRLARANQRNLPSCKGKPWSYKRRISAIERTLVCAFKKVLKEKNCSDEYTYDWLEVRKAIYKRDRWTCQECLNKCNTGIGIACHHIDYIKSNNDFMNLITLCTSCHGKTVHKSEHWIQYYQDKMMLRLTSENDISH